MKPLEDLVNNAGREKLRKHFREHGFIYYPGFLNPDEIDLVRTKTVEFIAQKVSTMPAEQVYYEDKADKTTLKQLQELFKYDVFFQDLIFNSRFKKLASILLNERVIGKNIQYFNKPPRIGNPTPPHQDGFYFKLVPNQAVTMWLPLEEVDEENGCVRYVRGSHLAGLRPHGRSNILGFSQCILDFNDEDREKEVFFPVRPGDLLVHHALTIHRADGNKSPNRSRKALGFIYYAANAKQDLQAVEAHLRKLNTELKKQAKI